MRIHFNSIQFKSNVEIDYNHSVGPVCIFGERWPAIQRPYLVRDKLTATHLRLNMGRYFLYVSTCGVIRALQPYLLLAAFVERGLK